MTQGAEDATSYRYSVSAEATERQLRLCGFVLLNQCLVMHHVLARYLELQPVELLILPATTTGIPKEAVRRHVAGMIARGILHSTPTGVRAPNRLTEHKALEAILDVAQHCAGSGVTGMLRTNRPGP